MGINAEYMGQFWLNRPTKHEIVCSCCPRGCRGCRARGRPSSLLVVGWILYAILHLLWLLPLHLHLFLLAIHDTLPSPGQEGSGGRARSYLLLRRPYGIHHAILHLLRLQTLHLAIHLFLLAIHYTLPSPGQEGSGG